MTGRERVTGLDVSYGEGTSRAVAAAVTLELATLEVVEVALFDGEPDFPYVPGSLALREAPLLLRALEKLKTEPEVLVCDGYGVAHPDRFGLACHVGRESGLPTFGVAKTPFLARFSELGPERGAWSDLVMGEGEIVGRALRTQTGVKPVFVSVGQAITLDEATKLT